MLAQPTAYIGNSIEIAGDEMTPVDMCEAFTEAQDGSPVVVHSCPPAWMLWLISKCASPFSAACLFCIYAFCCMHPWPKLARQ